MHAPELSDAELEQFWSEGFLRLGQVAPAAEIEALRCRADEILLGDVTYPDMSFMLCPSAVDLTDRWEAAAQGPGGVASAVQQLRTLKYRKVQGFEHDPLFLRYAILSCGMLGCKRCCLMSVLKGRALTSTWPTTNQVHAASALPRRDVKNSGRARINLPEHVLQQTS